jgi:hypothetical protein
VPWSDSGLKRRLRAGVCSPSTVLYVAQRLVQIREVPTHGLLGVERTVDRNISGSLRAQLAVISCSVLDWNTERRDCRSPSGEVAQRRKRLSDLGYPRIIRPERSIPIVLRYVQWRCQFSRIQNGGSGVAFGHFGP